MTSVPWNDSRSMMDNYAAAVEVRRNQTEGDSEHSEVEKKTKSANREPVREQLDDRSE